MIHLVRSRPLVMVWVCVLLFARLTLANPVTGALAAAGAAGAPPGKPPPLLQPADPQSTRVSLGNPEHARQLIKEMSRQWDGMDNPMSHDWDSVWSEGNGKRTMKTPSSLVGTPDDPFTPKFGPWRAPPRGTPPPNVYDTFVFDPKHPFRRQRPVPAWDPNMMAHSTNSPPVWHPIMGVKNWEKLDQPKVVVPVPKPIYRNLPNQAGNIPGIRRSDYVYENVPKRPQIARPDRLPPNPHADKPMSYEYPPFHVLNPRSQFTRHNPKGTNMHAYGDAFLETSTVESKSSPDATPRPTRRQRDRLKRPHMVPAALLETASKTKEAHKANDPFAAGLVQGAVGAGIASAPIISAGMPRPVGGMALNTGNTIGNQPMQYKFYPYGREGIRRFRGPPMRKRNENYQAELAAHYKAKLRDSALVDRMVGDPPGPYGHGYNHQPGAPNEVPPPLLTTTKKEFDGTKPVDLAAQVQDSDRAGSDPSKLLNDDRLPYIGSQGKQEAADYKMTPEPSLEPNGPGSDADIWHGAQVIPLSPEIQPKSHPFYVPKKPEKAKAPEGAVAKYVAHYPKQRAALEASGKLKPDAASMPAEPMTPPPPRAAGVVAGAAAPHTAVTTTANNGEFIETDSHVRRTKIPAAELTPTPAIPKKVAEKAKDVVEPDAAVPKEVDPTPAFREQRAPTPAVPVNKAKADQKEEKAPDADFDKLSEQRHHKRITPIPPDNTETKGRNTAFVSYEVALVKKQHEFKPHPVTLHEDAAPVAKQQPAAAEQGSVSTTPASSLPPELIETQSKAKAETKTKTETKAKSEDEETTPWWERKEAIAENSKRPDRSDIEGTMHLNQQDSLKTKGLAPSLVEASMTTTRTSLRDGAKQQVLTHPDHAVPQQQQQQQQPQQQAPASQLPSNMPPNTASPSPSLLDTAETVRPDQPAYSLPSPDEINRNPPESPSYPPVMRQPQQPQQPAFLEQQAQAQAQMQAQAQNRMQAQQVWQTPPAMQQQQQVYMQSNSQPLQLPRGATNVIIVQSPSAKPQAPQNNQLPPIVLV